VKRPAWRIKAYRLGLVFAQRDDGSLRLETRDLDAVARALGRPLFVEFLRCFVASDRLTSLAELLHYDQSPKGSFSQRRNVLTCALLAGGALYEAADAIHHLEPLLPRDVTDLTEWTRLTAMAARWRRSGGMLRQLRNKVAFHVDRPVVEAGLAALTKGAGKVVLVGGDTRRRRHASHPIATDALLAGLGFNERQARGLAKTLSSDHGMFGELVLRVFHKALKARGAGLP
jgi:hypothetical protein